MNSYVQLKAEQQSRAVANTCQRKGEDSLAATRQPNRLGDLQESANLNPEVQHVAQMKQMLNGGSRTSAPLGRKENQTGMPDHLKTGIERLSNLSMDDVKVQYNSPRPAQFQALAITQGKDIHVGPGQERHLPHEAWHLVQQKQGRVRATTQMRGTAINDDSALEHEADVMGALAARAAETDQGHDHAGELSRPGDEGLGKETSSSRDTARPQAKPFVAQRVVMAIPDTNPTQYRSTLITGQTFPSAAAAQAAEQTGMAAIEAERQRLQREREQQAEAERQAAEAELERRRAERNPQFAPPPLYQQPVAMNNPPPPQPILPLLAAREIGAHNQHQLQAQGERLEERREMEGIDPQLHQFLQSRYGNLAEI